MIQIVALIRIVYILNRLVQNLNQPASAANAIPATTFDCIVKYIHHFQIVEGSDGTLIHSN
jgi:hypothetical protein